MPVIHSRHPESGKVSVERLECIRCGMCVEICPSESLVINLDGYPEQQPSGLGCIGCGHCMMICPQNCINIVGRNVSQADLFELSNPESRATYDALVSLMDRRRSIRRFTDQVPDIKLLQKIVETASRAPMGIPPWDVGCTIVHGFENVRELSSRIIDGYEQVLRLFKPWLLGIVRPFMKKSMIEQFKTFIIPLGQSYIEGRKSGKDRLFYSAPSVLIFHHSPYADPIDASIACTYAMLAAESLGLGTTMIGACAPIMQRNKKLCEKYHIPEGNKPSIAMIVGYPAVKFERSIARTFLSMEVIRQADFAR